MGSVFGDPVRGNTVKREEDTEGGWVEVRDEEKKSTGEYFIVGSTLNDFGKDIR